jgi:hypothetical protein
LDEAGGFAPIEMPGEIHIGGAGVAIGYHHRPELTAERFIPNRFSSRSGARLYRTGDLGRWGADGKLYHLGRLDDQVKVRGFRIEPGEIETALRSEPAVREAVVATREAQPGDQRLIAYVVYHDGKDLTTSDLRRHLRHLLPEFMIPSMVVSLTSLPRTPNGKIDRGALPNPFKAAQTAVAPHEPPAPGVERMIADIWQSVLGVNQVSAADNFFELGGHSLLSLRVVRAVEKKSQYNLDPRALFFHNLRQIAALVERKATSNDMNDR